MTVSLMGTSYSGGTSYDPSWIAYLIIHEQWLQAVSLATSSGTARIVLRVAGVGAWQPRTIKGDDGRPVITNYQAEPWGEFQHVAQATTQGVGEPLIWTGRLHVVPGQHILGEYHSWDTAATGSMRMYIDTVACSA